MSNLNDYPGGPNTVFGEHQTGYDRLEFVQKVALIAWNPTTLQYVKISTDSDGNLNVNPLSKTLKSVAFSLSATGEVIPAVATKRLKIYALKLIVSAAISVKFRDGAATDLEGAQAMAANGGVVENVVPPSFLFATTAGNALDLVISGVGTAAGRVSYWDDDDT